MASKTSKSASNLPTRQEVLGTVWQLLQSASSADEPDYPACAKFAELLVKHVVQGEELKSSDIPKALQAEIEKAI